MPGLWAHSHFFANATPSTTAVVVTSMRYPAWQSTPLFFGTGLGGLQIAWDWLERRRAARKET